MSGQGITNTYGGTGAGVFFICPLTFRKKNAFCVHRLWGKQIDERILPITFSVLRAKHYELKVSKCPNRYICLLLSNV